MAPNDEHAALVALLRAGKRPWAEYAATVEEDGGALAILREEQGLLADEQLEHANAALARWDQRGIQVVAVTDPAYPGNLRAVHDRPPLIFVAGDLTTADDRAVAVVGARQASDRGIKAAGRIAAHLTQTGYTVVSGLAAGIDTAAHAEALRAGGRTVAVIGTGIDRCYPPENARLQHEIAAKHAVVSQFWPEAPPSRRTFPMRNAVISGLSLASVIVEASETSGTRIQARLALAQGRPVLLLESLLEQPWARELAAHPGAYVVRSPAEITAIVERLTAPGALIA